MKFTIKVPATSANIGPGFDTAGIAFELYNEFTFDFDVKGIHFYDPAHQFDTSLTLNTFFEVLDMFEVIRPTDVLLTTKSRIPVARGLGSSSTCIVAGIFAANEYANLNLNRDNIAKIASKIEGHPDNVIPAIYGHLTVSLLNEDDLFIQKIIPSTELAFIAIIPNHEIQTQEARNILPKSYFMGDLIFSMSRTAFLLKAFETANPKLLKVSTQDKLHEPYRKKLISDYSNFSKAIESTQRITSWISGAGPTIIVLTNKENAKQDVETLQQSCGKFATITILQTDIKGAMID